MVFFLSENQILIPFRTKTFPSSTIFIVTQWSKNLTLIFFFSKIKVSLNPIQPQRLTDVKFMGCTKIEKAHQNSPPPSPGEF